VAVHIPDGWVDLPTSAAAGVVAVAGTAVAARRGASALRDRATTMPAVVAAYVLVAQLLVLPVGFGTSAHLVGTGLAAVLVGPSVAIVCVAVVVVTQALVLADGGVTALGLNLINDGLVPALVAWGLFVAARPLVRRAPEGRPRRRAAAAAGGVAAGIGSLAAAAAATGAFAVGGTDAVPTSVVAASIGGAHAVLAVVEAGLTAAILAAVLRLRPDLVRAMPRPAPAVAPDSEPAPAAAGGMS
jgi:cobalt/nickel transport system permease protein